jgi:hypothetical protein
MLFTGGFLKDGKGKLGRIVLQMFWVFFLVHGFVVVKVHFDDFCSVFHKVNI